MIRIKPLEWNHFDGDYHVASSVVGQFNVRHGRWCYEHEPWSAEMRDDETAKAAAQAYYESLIRSTLEV